MAANPPVPPVPPAPVVVTPEEQLKTKLAAYRDAQDGITALSQKTIGLQSEIKILQAKVNELQQALTGYEATASSQQKKVVSLRTVSDQKLNMAKAVLGDLTAQIDAKISEFDQKLAAQNADVKKASDAAQSAMADAKAAEANALAKRAAYEGLRKSPGDVDTALKGIAALLDLAGKSEQQADYSALYLYLTEVKRLNQPVVIPSATDYEKAVRTAQDQAVQATADSVAKSATATQLNTTYQTMKQQLEAANNSRLADLQKALAGVVKPKAAGA